MSLLRLVALAPLLFLLALATGPSSVAILPFTATPSLDSSLAPLKQLLPQALAALLETQGLTAKIVSTPPGSLTLAQASGLIRAHQAGAVIAGQLSEIQGTLVVTARRYGLVDGRVERVRLAVATTGTPSNLLSLGTRVLLSLFPHQLSSLARSQESLAQLVLEPGVLSLPVGGAAPLTVLALNGSGQPIPGVRFVYQSSNSSVAMVGDSGVVRALSPGTTALSASAIGVSNGGSGTAAARLTVLPPFLGLRLGYAGSFSGAFHGGLSFGLILTPITGPVTVPSLPTPSTSGTSSSLFSLVGSFFGSILSGGNLSLGLSFLGGTTTLALLTYQWSGSGYLGTGVLYQPDGSGAAYGLRLSLGEDLTSPGRASLPLEVDANVLFRAQGPEVQISLMTGLNLFQ